MYKISIGRIIRFRILRFERFKNSAESSNRILKPKDVESNLKISGAESNIESNLRISWTRLEYRIES